MLFIQAQYSSIYDITAYAAISRKITLSLALSGVKFLEKEKLTSLESVTSYFHKEKERMKKKDYFCWGNLHPLKIILQFWRDFGNKLFYKNKKAKLKLKESEESILYQLIIIGLIFFTLINFPMILDVIYDIVRNLFIMGLQYWIH